MMRNAFRKHSTPMHVLSPPASDPPCCFAASTS
uniref:Uncharacterized protein n=1 Tax=Arundo donax TaxID=35708 RepID=A0A0A9FNT1_ARUDO